MLSTAGVSDLSDLLSALDANLDTSSRLALIA